VADCLSLRQKSQQRLPLPSAQINKKPNERSMPATLLPSGLRNFKQIIKSRLKMGSVNRFD
jgi:hypothetical protein